MKKFVQHTLMFLALFGVIFSGLNIHQANHPFEPTHYHKKYAALFTSQESDQDINGIIIGNSLAAYSLKPSILDQTAVRYYNFAYGRADLDFYMNWFDHIFPLYDRPVEHCIISVDRSFFNPGRPRLVEQDSEYFPLQGFTDIILNSDMNSTSLFLNKFPAFKYRKELLKTIFEEQKPEIFETDKYDRGYIPYNKPFKARHFVKKQITQVEISNEKRVRFENLLTRLQEAGITVKMILTPEYGFSPEKNSVLLNYLNDVSVRFSIDLYDFNGKYANVNFENAAYYSDMRHLNEAGSDLLSSLWVKAIGSTDK
ncbi:MAG: hypothetical protein Roseis2KO_32720 [Roseivirga sp.]